VNIFGNNFVIGYVFVKEGLVIVVLILIF